MNKAIKHSSTYKCIQIQKNALNLDTALEQTHNVLSVLPTPHNKMKICNQNKKLAASTHQSQHHQQSSQKSSLNSSFDFFDNFHDKFIIRETKLHKNAKIKMPYKPYRNNKKNFANQLKANARQSHKKKKIGNQKQSCLSVLAELANFSKIGTMGKIGSTKCSKRSSLKKPNAMTVGRHENNSRQISRLKGSWMSMNRQNNQSKGTNSKKMIGEKDRQGKNVQYN